MKKISRERFEYLKGRHYELWDWLVENPDKCKWEWEGFKDIDEETEDYCFACQFSYEADDGNYCCDYCPLGRKNIGCGVTNSLYENWCDLKMCCSQKGLEHRAELARQIRDLPWSDEFVED